MFNVARFAPVPLVALVSVILLTACTGKESSIFVQQRTPSDVYFRCVQANGSLTGNDKGADCGLTVDYCWQMREVTERKHDSQTDCLLACKQPRRLQPASMDTFICERVFSEGEAQCERYCKDTYPQ